MIIVKGKRHYKRELDQMVKIDGDGWDRYDGQNYQWYSLYYNKDTGLVKLEADNSGSCYGDYSTKYFNSPREFMNSVNSDNALNYVYERTVGDLLGNIDESNEDIMAFVNAAYPERE